MNIRRWMIEIEKKKEVCLSNDKLLQICICMCINMTKYLTSPSDIVLDEITAATSYPKHRIQREERKKNDNFVIYIFGRTCGEDQTMNKQPNSTTSTTTIQF